MEQLAARRAHNPKVAGSSPALATKKVKPYSHNDCKVLLFSSAYKNQSLIGLFLFSNLTILTIMIVQ